jgi:diaminohydroxyphosphoribosylaminopyrimidine deaminase / 5-amino-6-(5-phosphoribosylamino)uracil reductase
LQDLARRGTNELHVEAGATLTGHWISEGHADELLVYMAPMLLGSGAPVATLPVLDALPERTPWRFEGGSQQVGQDLRVRLIRAPSEPDHWCPVPA